MNSRIYRAQERWLAWLKQQTLPRLKFVHRRVFLATGYDAALPRTLRKRDLIARIFMYYCMKHPYLPLSHPWTKFNNVATDKLLRETAREWRTEGLASWTREALKYPTRFTWEKILDMDEPDVDRYLTLLHVQFGGVTDALKKRRWLWEAMNTSKDLDKPLGERVTMKELIMQSPDLCYDEFRAEYGGVLPNLTRKRWKDARYKLKRMGYPIQRVKSP